MQGCVHIAELQSKNRAKTEQIHSRITEQIAEHSNVHCVCDKKSRRRDHSRPKSGLAVLAGAESDAEGVSSDEPSLAMVCVTRKCSQRSETTHKESETQKVVKNFQEKKNKRKICKVLNKVRKKMGVQRQYEVKVGEPTLRW